MMKVATYERHINEVEIATVKKVVFFDGNVVDKLITITIKSDDKNSLETNTTITMPFDKLAMVLEYAGYKHIGTCPLDEEEQS